MMIDYLSRLKQIKSKNTHVGNLNNLNNHDDRGNLGLLGKPPDTFQNTKPIVSRWWRVHFIDHEPVEYNFQPDVDFDQAITYSGGISAEALAHGTPTKHKPDKFDHWSDEEIKTALARTKQFVNRGVPVADADRLACRLVTRDRQDDDRRSCAECFSMVRGRCRHGLEPIGGGGIQTFHRCIQFNSGVQL